MVLTAGIGVTPALRIAQSLADAESSRPVTMIHVDRTDALIPHLDELISNTAGLISSRLHIFLTQPSTSQARWRIGRPTPEFLRQQVLDPAQTSFFVCGPVGFIEDVSTVLRQSGVAAESILIDPSYSPLPADATVRTPPSPGPFSVRWANGGVSTWEIGEGTLLDLAETAGLAHPAGCRSGACGTCEASVRGPTYAVLEPANPPPRRPGPTLHGGALQRHRGHQLLTPACQNCCLPALPVPGLRKSDAPSRSPEHQRILGDDAENPVSARANADNTQLRRLVRDRRVDRLRRQDVARCARAHNLGITTARPIREREIYCRRRSTRSTGPTYQPEPTPDCGERSARLRPLLLTSAPAHLSEDEVFRDYSSQDNYADRQEHWWAR